MGAFFRTISGFAAGLVLTGCATAPPSRYSVPNARFYPASKDVMWERVMALFAENSMYVTASDKASGVVSFERADVAPNRSGAVYDWADCGAVGLMERPVNQLADLNVVVQATPGGARVVINSRFSEKREDLQRKARRVSCTSTGALEMRMLELLAHS